MTRSTYGDDDFEEIWHFFVYQLTNPKGGLCGISEEMRRGVSKGHVTILKGSRKGNETRQAVPFGKPTGLAGFLIYLSINNSNIKVLVL